MTGNELSSNFAYSTQAELKPSKVWLGSFPPLVVTKLLNRVISDSIILS